MVGTLNYRFNVANIFFKYKGYDNVTFANNYSSTGGTVFDKRNMSSSDFLANGQIIPAVDVLAINIFVCDRIANNAGVEAVMWPYNNSAGIKYRLIGICTPYLPTLNNGMPTNEESKTEDLVHEMGHVFDLYHTHQKWVLNSANQLVAASDNACPALVENLDNSQATIYGDLVQDTNPDRVKNGEYYSNCTFNPASYTTEMTCSGTFNLAQFNPPYYNIMAYYPVCRSTFSQMQFDRMRAFINTETQPGKFLVNSSNTIASLYEPYKIIPRWGAITITDDGVVNGMSLVCRRQSGAAFLYQKGFNYTFNRFGDITTRGIHQIPNYNDYGEFSITPLSPTFTQEFGWTCWRGEPVCQLEAIAGATKFSTLNLGSQTITETVLTATQLESPTLISDMPPMSYNILVKQTATGETATETIYKNNRP